MKLQGDYLFDAPVDEVWKALFDPVVLAAVMPGCEKLDLVDGAYVGDLNIKVGPVQGKFTGKVDLKDIDEPRSYTMVVDGRGAPGFVKATASVKLEAEGPNQTRIRYDADAQVGGKIASVGQRLLEASSRAITKQSLDGLNANIKLRYAASTPEPEPAPVAEAKPAAEAEPTAEASPAVEAKPVVEAKPGPPAGSDAAPAAASTEAATSEDAFGKAEVLSEATAATGGDASLEGAEIVPAAPAPAVPAPLKKPAAPVAVVKVDQNALAASIAKEVTKSLVPKPVAIALALAVAGLVIWLLAR